jgi:Pregnancy-associated plasma protein-A
MKKLFLLLTLLCFVINVSAQERKSGCGSDELHLKNIKENATYKDKFDKSNTLWQKYALKKQKESTSANKSIVVGNSSVLNVVFHDMNGATATTTPNYINAINDLNTIFTTSQINFCLATRKLNGDNYSGTSINHITIITALDKSSTAQITTIVDNSLSQDLDQFPTENYINIYVVDDITGGVAGFAYLPSSHGTHNDGIFIERRWLLASSADDIKILAHEMGHYLGLFHVFGICDPFTTTDPIATACSCDNGNPFFNGDMVQDTPPSRLQITGYNCAPASFPNTCATDNMPGDVADDKSNYMDYGFEACKNHFTSGQAMRMQFMIDPISGVRKSLLGASTCVDCTAMNNCDFSIVPATALSGIRNEIVQTATGTPNIVFDSQATCSITRINYTWSLSLLGSPNTVVATNSGTSFTLASTLVPGNYQLTMVGGINANCTEVTTYNFVIIPIASPTCNFELPTNNTSWEVNGWERISFAGGWVRNDTTPFNYVSGSSGPQTIVDSGFNPNGFDIIPLTSGQQIPGDVNFTGITLPTAATNVTRIMRVGEVIANGANIANGTAYYAKVTLPINANNCRYRIWYLGASEGTSTAYPPFNIATPSGTNDAAFGFLNRYNYNSNAGPTLSVHNSGIGMDDNGLMIPPYTTNDYYTNFANYLGNDMHYRSFGDYGTYSNTALNRTTQWVSKIVDYSEFVGLNPDSDITLTFFSHSNVTSGVSLQNAYGYYAIECLGGGTPGAEVILNIPDISIPCSSPNPNQAEFSIPLPTYMSNDINPYYSDIANFLDVQVLLENQSNPGVFDTNVSFAVQGSNTNNTKVFLYNIPINLAPCLNYRIIYRTLHATLQDDFRVCIGFTNNPPPPCTNGGAVDTDFHPGIVNGDIFLCADDPLPELHLTPTCIDLPHTFQWFWYGVIPIQGATDESLILVDDPALPNNPITASNNFETNQNGTVYVRKTIFNDPYCGNPLSILSEEFHIYQVDQTLNLYDISVVEQDICLGQNYNLSINNLHISGGNNYPAHFGLNNLVNTLTFQMFDPASNVAIGNTQTITYTGQIPFTQLLASLNFVYDNIDTDPISGLTSFHFTPSLAQNTFPISLRTSFCNYF